MLLAILGLVDGLVMAFKRTMVPCPSDRYFVGDCYVHPHAGVGLAIAVCSVLLGVSVALSGTTAAAILRAGSASAAVDVAERPATP
jgi:hypothetical protein